MTLHTLTSQGGAFVLKLGLVFRKEAIRLDGFFFGMAFARKGFEHNHATA